MAEQTMSVDEPTRRPATNMKAARIGRASKEAPGRGVLVSMVEFSL
jgi:hypothetical protein